MEGMPAQLPPNVIPETPGPGQESVWDYPRPPRLERSGRLVTVRSGEVLVAQSSAAFRVLETSHPPTWYLPTASIVDAVLRRSGAPSTMCEWKGPATYWDVLLADGAGERMIQGAVWSYERPTRPFRDITGYLAFSPSDFDCAVDGAPARPQQGGFYGGWITDDVVGPFKGTPGSWGW
jgi:uncharacterized protein (DUF427 family)